MVLYIVVLLALTDVITSQVLTLNLRRNDSENVACNFDNPTYLSLYTNLKQATTLSVQYTCNAVDGKPESAVIKPIDISHSNDYQCLYTCSYTEPTITCTRQRKDINIVLSQANFLPIISLIDSYPSHICVPTIWSEFKYAYDWKYPSIVLNNSCAPLCDGDNYINQTQTTQIPESTKHTLLTSRLTPSSTENNGASITSKTLSLSSSTSITKTSPATSQAHGADDTVTTIIIGACVGGGLFLILCLVVMIVLICTKRKKRPHRKHSFTDSDNEINNGSKPKENVVENKVRTEQEHPIFTSHIGNYNNGIQIINNKVEIPVNDYELPEYNTHTKRDSINNKLNLINNRVLEKETHLKKMNESSNVDLKQKSNDANSDTEVFGYATTEDVSTKNDVYSKLGEESREFQNPYNVMPDDAADGSNLNYKHTERAHHEDGNSSSRDPGQTGQQQVNSSRDNMPVSANVHHVDDSHMLHPASGDIYAQVVKTKL